MGPGHRSLDRRPGLRCPPIPDVRPRRRHWPGRTRLLADGTRTLVRGRPRRARLLPLLAAVRAGDPADCGVAVRVVRRHRDRRQRRLLRMAVGPTRLALGNPRAVFLCARARPRQRHWTGDGGSGPWRVRTIGLVVGRLSDEGDARHDRWCMAYRPRGVAPSGCFAGVHGRAGEHLGGVLALRVAGLDRLPRHLQRQPVGGVQVAARSHPGARRWSPRMVVDGAGLAVDLGAGARSGNGRLPGGACAVVVTSGRRERLCGSR